jgi:hypothetical protein
VHPKRQRSNLGHTRLGHPAIKPRRRPKLHG